MPENPLSALYARAFKRLTGKGLGLGVFTAMHSLLWDRWLRPDEVTVHGFTLRLPRGADETAHTLIMEGNYEPALTAAFQEHIRPGMFVLDIGASFGYYSLLASGLVGPEGRVMAFEPYLANFELLLQNLRTNRRANVYPVSLGVSRESGFGSIHASSQSLVFSYGGDKQPCLTAALDAFLADFPKPNAIKMDVEGSEMSAMDAMERTLSAPELRVLFIECLPAALAEAGFTPADMHARLKGCGFAVSQLDERNLLCLRN